MTRTFTMLFALAPAACAVAALAVVPACAGANDDGDDDDDDDDDDDGGEGEGDVGEGEGEAGEGEGEAGEGEGEGGEGEGLSDLDAAVRALNAEVRPRFLLEELLELSVGTSAAAAELTGANTFVLSGTVDARGATATYSATPADALVLRLPDGDTRFVIASFALDANASTVEEAFLSEHDVDLQASRAGAFDLRLKSSQIGAEGERSAVGTFVDDGVTLNASLFEGSTVTVEVDTNFVRYDGITDRNGTVTGAGVNVTTAETDTNVLVITTDAFENRTTDFALTGTVDGRAFAMPLGTIRRSFTNSTPDEVDFWSETNGALAKDGAAFGSIGFRVGDLGAFEIVLTAGADEVVLESYAP